MSEHLTDQTRLVLSLANHEAHQIDWSYIGPEHLLLGILQERENSAGQVLRLSGVSFETAHSEMFRHVCVGKDARATDDQITLPLTPRAAEVFRAAGQQAARREQSLIAPEHLLLGMIAVGEGVGAQILIGLGVNLGGIARQVSRLIQEREVDQRERPESA